MPPSALLARMGQRFKLMAGLGRRQDRQSTLRATFDWSWDLLIDAEKSALAQLSVFEGGFTLEAAEAVLDLSDCADAPWTVDLLQSLVDKSLVRPLGAARFDLLSSVQDYAAEQLQCEDRFPGSGDGAQTKAERAHCAHFAGLDTVAATARGGVEIDNLVAACRRALCRGDVSQSTAALENAWAALDLRGATLDPAGATLRTSALFGGGNVIVPDPIIDPIPEPDPVIVPDPGDDRDRDRGRDKDEDEDRGRGRDGRR